MQIQLDEAQNARAQISQIDIGRLNQRISGVVPRTSFIDASIMLGMHAFPVAMVRSIMGS